MMFYGSRDYRDQHIRQTARDEIGRELQISSNYYTFNNNTKTKNNNNNTY